MNKYINTIKHCHKIISNDIINTPLNFNKNLSEQYKANIYFKREDLQITRSFKLRGSLNKIKSIDKSILNNSNGVICASAGNHAQGFAYSCNKLNIYGCPRPEKPNQLAHQTILPNLPWLLFQPYRYIFLF